tara:strand:+ start:675 stop:1577 length:903 start_codon:yes stop_codon:yes gene_type:complete
MYNWVFITIFAATMQTTRTSLQKSLTQNLSAEAITWVRYSFGLPVVIIYIIILNAAGLDIPEINRPFAIYCVAAGIFQIIATILLVSLFSHRNFAVSTAYAKTEAIQAAIIGSVLFGEYVNFFGSVAIAIGVLGVILISISENSITWKSLLLSIRQRSTFIGIACGGTFALDALLIREAILVLDNESSIMNAAFTLISLSTINLFILGSWIIYKDLSTFKKIKLFWKTSALVGLTSAIGSIGWFTGFALTQVAYVKTVGQIELLFSILVTQKIFKEGINKIELTAILAVSSSILLLIQNV